MILALLFTSIHIRLRYNGSGYPSAVLSFLGIFRKTLYPLPKRTKKAKKKRKRKAESQKRPATPQKDKLSRRRRIRELRSLIAAILIRMPHTFTLHIKRFVIRIGSDDAAKTALLYGAASSSLAFTLEWLDRHLLTIRRSKRAPFTLNADFSSDEIFCDIELVLSSSLFRLLRLASTTLLPHFFKHVLKKRRRRKAAKQMNSKNFPD